jgi:predicted nucleic acid-binding protein
MIVVDTNTIAYLYLPSEHTRDTERVLEKDPHWVAPFLWRSEFRNILARYVRTGIIDLAAAAQMQSRAEAQLSGNEYTVDSLSVLNLAQASHCSAYDCEFIAVAKTLRTHLVTADKQLTLRFPALALTASAFLRT